MGSLLSPVPVVYYSSAVASTNLATFTTEDNLMKGMPLLKLPDLGQVLGKLGDQTSTMKLRGLGQAGAVSATTPTFTYSLRALTSSTWSAGGVLLGASTACTCVSGITLGVVQFDIDIWLRTGPVPGTPTITVVTGGTISGSAFSSLNTIPAAGTAPTSTTLDVTQQYYLFLSAACSASNAANLTNLQGLKLYVES